MTNNRVVKGILQISDRQYAVYEGINLIGRDQKATIILKDSAVSHQQAIIVVVNENEHFISDTYSSNGTWLDETSLIPFQLYELTDDCNIQFADVHATYRKITKEGYNDVILNGNDGVYTQSAFVAHTQLLEKRQPDINETTPMNLDIHVIETQRTFNDEPITIHDLPTQVISRNSPIELDETVCSEKTDVTDIHDLPTQVLDTNQPSSSTTLQINEDVGIADNESEKTISLPPTSPQRNNDVDTDVTDDEAEKTAFVSQEQNEPKKELENVIEETVIESVNESRIVEDSDESNASLDLMTNDIENGQRTANIELVSENTPTSTQESDLKVGLLKKKLSHRIESESESETDIESTVPTEANRVSDSDTDDRLHLSQLRRRTRQLLHSDSEDDSEVNTTCINNESAANSKQFDDSDIIPSTQDMFNEKSWLSSLNSKNTVTEKENMKCDDFTSRQSTNSLNSNNTVTEKENAKCDDFTSQQSASSTSMENFKLGLTQLLVNSEPDSNLNSEEKSSTPSSQPANVNVQIKDAVNLPTSDHDAVVEISTSTVVGKEDDNDAKIIVNTAVAKEDDDIIFLQPTQHIPCNNTSNNNSAGTSYQKIDSNTDDDIYLMATQKIINNDNILQQQPQIMENEGDDLDIYALPTQKIVSNSKETEINDVACNLQNVDDELYLQPTQKIIRNSAETETNEEVNNLENVDDEIYLQPTQKICHKDSSERKRASLDNDLFLQPTQRVPISIEEDDIYNAATQVIVTEPKVENARKDEYLTSTQEMESQLDGIFSTQTIKYIESSSERPRNPLADTLKEIDDDNKEDSQNDHSYKTIKSTSKTAEEDCGKVSSIEALNSSSEKSRNLANTHKNANDTMQGFHHENRLVQSETAESTSVKQDFAKISRAQIMNKIIKKSNDSIAEALKKINDNKEDSHNEESHLCQPEPVKSAYESPKEDYIKISNAQPAKSCTETPNSPHTDAFKRIKNSNDNEESPSRTPKEDYVKSKNSPLGKHKLDTKPSVNSKKMKLIEEVSQKSSDIRNEVSSNAEKSRLQKSTITVKKAAKSNDIALLSDEIKITAFHSRTRRTALNLKENTSVVSTKRNTKKNFEITSETPSTSCIDDTSIVPKRSTRNKKTANDSHIETNNRCEPDSPSKPVKRKTNSTLNPTTPVKRNKTRASERQLSISSTSSTSTSINSTPKSTVSAVEANSTLALNTPERSRRKQKPKVVFTMFDSPELESVVRQLGGSMVDTIDTATVLVTENVKRTQKLLMAIGQGKPICSPNWIRQSKAAGQFLDPWEHILIDKEAEKKWNFSLKASLARSQRSKLLENYIVILTVSNAVDVLKGAVEACGGKCFTNKAPPKNLIGELVVVSAADNKTKCNKYLKRNPKPLLVAPEAIFDGVLRQELHFEEHLIE